MGQPNDFDNDIWQLIDEEERLTKELAYNFKEYDYLFVLRKYASHLKFGLDDLATVRNTIFQGQVADQKSLLRLYTQVEYHYVSLFSLGLSLEEHLYKGLKDYLTESSLSSFHQTVLDPWKKSEPVRLFKEIRNRIQHGKFFEGNFHYFYDLQVKEASEKVSWSFERDDNFWTSVYGKIDLATKAYFDSKVKINKHKLLFVVTEYQKSLNGLTENVSTMYESLFPDASGRRSEMEQKLQDIQAKLAQKNLLSPF